MTPSSHAFRQKSTCPWGEFKGKNLPIWQVFRGKSFWFFVEAVCRPFAQRDQLIYNTLIPRYRREDKIKTVNILSSLLSLLTTGCGLLKQNQVNELDLLLEAEKMPVGWTEYYRNNDMIDSEYQKKEASAGYSKSDKDWIARSTEKVFCMGIIE